MSNVNTTWKQKKQESVGESESNNNNNNIAISNIKNGDVVEKGVLEVDMENFKWMNTRYHITYKGHIQLKILLEWILTTSKPTKIKYYSLVNETSDNHHPYDHTHVLIWFVRPPRWRGSKKLLHPDCDANHYNIKIVQDDEYWDHVFFRYHKGYKIKEGIETFINPIDILQSENYTKKEKSFSKTYRDTVEYIKKCEDIKQLYDVENIGIGKYISSHIAWAERLFNNKNVDIETVIAQDGSNHKPWQKDMSEILQKTPNDRHLYWLFDEVGCTGKSQFMKWLIKYHGAFLAQGSQKDILYGYQGQRIVVFYCCKSMEDHISFQALECIKDGIFFVQKYLSMMKGFKSPHVIVLTNVPPDVDKCSLDRWIIWELDNFGGYTDMDTTIARCFHERRMHRLGVQQEERRKRIREEVYPNNDEQSDSKRTTSSASPFHNGYQSGKLLGNINKNMNILTQQLVQKQNTIHKYGVG